MNRERWVWAGASAAVALPLAVLGLGLPLWAGLGLSAATGMGAAILAGGPRRRGGLATPFIAPRRLDGVRAAIAEAEPACTRLEAIGPDIAASGVRDRARLMAETGRGLIEAVAAEPDLLAPAQRALIFYLPRAADLAAHYRDIEREAPPLDPRATALERVIAQLEAALAHTAAHLRAGEDRALEAEIKAVEAALREDFGPPKS